MAEQHRSPLPGEVIDYSHYKSLLTASFGWGKEAGNMFVSRIPKDPAAKSKFRAQVFFPDIRPVIDAAGLSAENDLPSAAVITLLTANGIQAAAVDWETVGQWRSQVLFPFYPLVERELAYRASDEIEVGIASFNARLGKELEACHSQFFTPGSFVSLVDSDDARRWGVNFPTRAALFTYAKYLSGFNHSVELEMSTSNMNIVRTYLDYIASWPLIFREMRPPDTKAEEEAARAMMEQKELDRITPGFGFRPDLPTRSQTKRRGLPGSISTQPDPPGRPTRG